MWLFVSLGFQDARESQRGGEPPSAAGDQWELGSWVKCSFKAWASVTDGGSKLTDHLLHRQLLNKSWSTPNSLSTRPMTVGAVERAAPRSTVTLTTSLSDQTLSPAPSPLYRLWPQSPALGPRTGGRTAPGALRTVRRACRPWLQPTPLSCGG